jgi:conjugal transfer pilus assembly protein TraF
MRRVIFLLVAALLLNVRGLPAVETPGMWTEHEKGWFWYNEIIPEEEPEEPEEPPIPPAASAPPEPAGPPLLSAQWIRENLEKYQILAIDDPTPENLAAYMYIQKVMLDKSQRFAEQFKHVVQLDPFLDQGTRRPIATFGGAQFSREAREARKRLLARISEQAGIFFFFQGNCGHCRIQAPVLKKLQENYGFTIFPISIDGQPLPNGMFPEFVADRGQARLLKVIQTPATFLGKPDTMDVIPLGQSAMSLDQMANRILVAARDAGWITPEEYNATRGFNASMALDLKPGSLPPDLGEDKLIEHIRKLYSRRLGGEGTLELAGDSENAVIRPPGALQEVAEGFGLSETAEDCGECQAKGEGF